MFTLLNIAGLSVGISACLILFLLIHFERSFDRFHAKGDRVYRVAMHYTGGPEGNHYFQGVPVPLPGALRRAFPQFQDVAPVCDAMGGQFTIPVTGGAEKKIRETHGVFYADPSLFDILDFPWLAGDPLTALRDPHTVAIGQSVAKAWFGDWTLAMGKTVTLDHLTPLTITGILRDAPDNTDLPLRIVMPFAGFPERDNQNWHDTRGNFGCFVLLAPGQRIDAVMRHVPAFVKTYYGGDDGPEKTSLYFEPLDQMHSDVIMGNFTGKKAPVELLWGLGLLGFLLIGVACINFINLATAQAVNQAKEVGVRKVLGSSRLSLVVRFFGETALITFAAIFIACILTELGLPYMRNLLGEPIYLPLFSSPALLLFLVATGLGVTLLSGSYPALVLSGFDPVTAIQHKVSKKAGGGLFLRRALVVLQFTVAQFLIIGTLVLVRQFDFFRHMPLGFDKDAVAMVHLPTDSLSQQRFAYAKAKMQDIPGVLGVSLCADAPSSRRKITSSFTFDNRTKSEDFDISIRMADADYFRTFRIGLAAGRLPYPSDTIREFVVNEKTVRKLGLSQPGDIVGKSISVWGRTYPVVGVVKDFNSSQLQNELAPIVLATQRDQYQYLAVRYDPKRIRQAMHTVQTTWEQIFPEYAYDMQYLDDNIAAYYVESDKVTAVLKIFAALALFVSCLGLYGLVAFMAVQRTKEVGIRKVLGATVGSIMVLFSREFTLLIGIAFLIAGSVGYYVMHLLISHLEYRIAIGVDVFAWAIGASVLLAWITVGYKALSGRPGQPLQKV